MSTDGAQKIILEIEKSAEQRVSEIQAEAGQNKDDVLGEARRTAEEQARGMVARGEQEARRESQRILAEARIQARREKVRAQESLVQESFSRAWEQLRKLAEQGSAEGISYAAVLERLIRESVVSAGAESLEVLVTARDKALLSAELLDKIAASVGSDLGQPVSLTLSGEALSCAGGAVVRSTDGRVRVDNTLESRIERFRDTIRTEVARELFHRE